MSEHADGKFVVVENGRKVTAPTDKREEAQAEADRRNKLAESQGRSVKEGQGAKVQQVICG